MRRSFPCSRCGVVLAVVSPRTVLRIVAGVGVSHHRKYGTMRLICRCGHGEQFAVPRQVEVIELWMGQEAA